MLIVHVAGERAARDHAPPYRHPGGVLAPQEINYEIIRQNKSAAN